MTRPMFGFASNDGYKIHLKNYWGRIYVKDGLLGRKALRDSPYFAPEGIAAPETLSHIDRGSLPC